MGLKARLSQYGREVRKLRVDKDMNLRQMAEALDVSSAYLSAIEKGDKPVPKHFPQKVVEALGLALDGKELRLLEEAVILDRGYVTVDIAKASPQAQTVAMRFANALGALTDVQLDAVMMVISRNDRNRAPAR